MAKAIAKPNPGEMEVAGFKLTKTGILVDGTPERGDWLEAKGFIDKCHSGAMWWIGDLLNFGEATYGEIDEDGPYDHNTIKNAKYVCDNVKASRRRDDLSFGHHQNVAHLPAKQQVTWLKRASSENLSVAEMRKAMRAKRLEEESEKHPLPVGTFRVILADPPWKYNDELVEGYGSAEHHYPTLATDELCVLADTSGRSVHDVSAPSAVLFLWATCPMLKDALQVIEAWGFEYKAQFVWDKVKHNYGHYNSVRHELLLIATKGSCVPDDKTLHDSVVEIERQEHSRKPDRFYEIVEQMYSTGPYLEMFARRPREGWVSWGNEA